MRFELWHNDHPTFRDNDPNELTRTFPRSYTKVAIIETDAVEQVFQLSNHIDSPWTANKEVRELPTGNRLRSTSVGDVIVNSETDEAWTIDMIGLTPFHKLTVISDPFYPNLGRDADADDQDGQ